MKNYEPIVISAGALRNLIFVTVTISGLISSIFTIFLVRVLG